MGPGIFPKYVQLRSLEKLDGMVLREFRAHVLFCF